MGGFLPGMLLMDQTGSGTKYSGPLNGQSHVWRDPEFYDRQGNPEGYYQEYLNRPIDPKHSFFKDDDFGEMDKVDVELPFENYP
jgi:hypothetical protein